MAMAPSLGVVPGRIHRKPASSIAVRVVGKRMAEFDG